MKLIKIALVTIVLLANLIIAQPSWADRPKLTQTEDYTQVTQTLDQLLQAKESPDQSDRTPEQIERRIGKLQLQKYILETAAEWSQCRNETGSTLAVYAHKAKKSAQPSTLYYLGNGQMTDDDWNCDGVLLPSGSKIAGLTPDDAEGLTEPIALKIISGTQFVATANPAGAVQFNVAPAQILNAGEGNLDIPNLSVADVSAQTPNAPIDD